MNGNYRIITLCGSIEFRDAYITKPRHRVKDHFKRTVMPLFLSLFLITLTFVSCDRCDKEEKTLILQPDSSEGIDAFIAAWSEENYSNRNFGTHVEFQASAWTSQHIPCFVRGLINFDLSPIPAHSKIIDANLHLFTVDNTVNGPGHSTLSGPNDFILQRITSDWDELSVSWNTQPATTTVNQVLVPSSDSTNQDYVIDISDLVQDIVNNHMSRFGLMMRLDNESYFRRILFASSDYKDPAKHPKLIVTYEY